MLNILINNKPQRHLTTFKRKLSQHTIQIGYLGTLSDKSSETATPIEH